MSNPITTRFHRRDSGNGGSGRRQRIPVWTAAGKQTLAAPSADPLALELANEALERRARRRRVVRRCARRTLSPADYSDARAPGQRGHRRRVVRPRHPHARERMLGICRDERDDAGGRAEGRARSRRAVARRARRAAAPRRARAGDARDRHVDDARAARPDRRAARGEDCAAAGGERSGAQGEERPLRHARACSCCAR